MIIYVYKLLNDKTGIVSEGNIKYEFEFDVMYSNAGSTQTTSVS